MRPRAAIDQAIADIVFHIHREVEGGASLPAVLAATGIHPSLAQRVSSSMARHGHSMLEALTVVFHGGPVEGIPTIECMERHLPKDRDPTEEEYDKAYAACANK